MHRACKKCGINKTIDSFRQTNGRNGVLYFKGICRSCESKQSNEWNKSNIISRKKAKSTFKASNPNYQNEYRDKNKNKIKAQRKEYESRPDVKLRKKISKYIKLNNLMVSVDEFKNIIEKQFEPWMNWDNWKKSWVEISMLPTTMAKPGNIVCKICNMNKPRPKNLVCNKCKNKQIKSRCITYCEDKEKIDDFILSNLSEENKICSKCKQNKLLSKSFRAKLAKIDLDGKIEKIYFDSECYDCNKSRDKSRDKIKLKQKSRRRYLSIKEKIKTDAKFREKYKAERREYLKKRIKRPKDIVRDFVSKRVGMALKCKGASKNNESIIKYLPYTIEQLKRHIELQFEPWMNWSNRGMYNSEKWNDNDKLTWKWNIDHIIPHSEFNYSSMNDPEFLECWALKNLRPLSAKQNVLEGINRTRHKKQV